MSLTITTIVCAYNERRLLPAGLHSLHAAVHHVSKLYGLLVIPGAEITQNPMAAARTRVDAVPQWVLGRVRSIGGQGSVRCDRA